GGFIGSLRRECETFYIRKPRLARPPVPDPGTHQSPHFYSGRQAALEPVPSQAHRIHTVLSTGSGFLHPDRYRVGVRVTRAEWLPTVTAKLFLRLRNGLY
ncbi:hypothetical protein JMJ77_0006006, partial [Colletotrichum scovillei]